MLTIKKKKWSPSTSDIRLVLYLAWEKMISPTPLPLSNFSSSPRGIISEARLPHEPIQETIIVTLFGRPGSGALPLKEKKGWN